MRQPTNPINRISTSWIGSKVQQVVMPKRALVYSYFKKSFYLKAITHAIYVLSTRETRFWKLFVILVLYFLSQCYTACFFVIEKQDTQKQERAFANCCVWFFFGPHQRRLHPDPMRKKEGVQMRVTNGLAVFIGFRHRRRPFWQERKKEGVQMRVQNGLGRMIKLAV